MRRTAIRAGSLFLGLSCGKGEPPRPASRPPSEAARQAPLHPHPRLYDRDTTDLVPALVEKMGKAPAEIQAWARARLSEEGEKAVEEIRRAFYSAYGRGENAPILAGLCEALALLRLASGVPILRDALGHPSGLVREKASDALASIGAPDAVADLSVVFQQDPNPAQRRSCMRAVAAARSPEAAAFLRGIVENRDLAPFRVEAAELIAWFPEPLARPALEPFLQTQARPLALAAAKGLARFGTPEALALLEGFEAGEDPALRAEALAGFAHAGRLDRIAPLARDPSPRVRLAAAAAVGLATGTAPKPAVPPPPWAPEARSPDEAKKGSAIDLLLPLIDDPDGDVRREAVRRLCGLGNRGVLDRYLRAVLSEVEKEWREALEVLVDPQVAEAGAVPGILERLSRTEGPARRPFLQALGHLRDPRGAEVLAADMRNAEGVRLEEGSLADYAAIQIANLGEAAIPHLRKALEKGEPPALRSRAVRSLTLMPVPQAADLLLSHAGEAGEDPSIRAIAIRAAPRSAGLRAAGPLKRALFAERDPALRDLLNCALHDYF